MRVDRRRSAAVRRSAQSNRRGCLRKANEVRAARADLIRERRASPALGPAIGWLLRSDGLDQPKLSQRGHAVVETDLLDDLALDHFQHRGAGEVHLAAGRGWQTAD